MLIKQIVTFIIDFIGRINKSAKKKIYRSHRPFCKVAGNVRFAECANSADSQISAHSAIWFCCQLALSKSNCWQQAISRISNSTLLAAGYQQIQQLDLASSRLSADSATRPCWQQAISRFSNSTLLPASRQQVQQFDPAGSRLSAGSATQPCWQQAISRFSNSTNYQQLFKSRDLKK